MGSFFTKIMMTEKQRIAKMSPRAKTNYLKCHSRRIVSREYYKQYPREWYAQYDY